MVSGPSFVIGLGSDLVMAGAKIFSGLVLAGQQDLIEGMVLSMTAHTKSSCKPFLGCVNMARVIGVSVRLFRSVVALRRNILSVKGILPFSPTSSWRPESNNQPIDTHTTRGWEAH